MISLRSFVSRLGQYRWYVDPARGDDKATGRTRRHPLKTFTELSQRIKDLRTWRQLTVLLADHMFFDSMGTMVIPPQFKAIRFESYRRWP